MSQSRHIHGVTPGQPTNRAWTKGVGRCWWHRWEVVAHRGIWLYRECKKCHSREVIRTNTRLMGPYDSAWLATGEWFNYENVEPPPKPSDVKRRKK